MQSKKEGQDHELINQAPHLTQDTIWESDKNTINHHRQESQEVSPFPAGNHKATVNRQENMTNMEHKLKNIIHKRTTALERSVKYFYWRVLTSFTAPTLPLVQMWIKTHRCYVCMKDH